MAENPSHSQLIDVLNRNDQRYFDQQITLGLINGWFAQIPLLGALDTQYALPLGRPHNQFSGYKGLGEPQDTLSNDFFILNAFESADAILKGDLPAGTLSTDYGKIKRSGKLANSDVAAIVQLHRTYVGSEVQVGDINLYQQILKGHISHIIGCRFFLKDNGNVDFRIRERNYKYRKYTSKELSQLNIDVSAGQITISPSESSIIAHGNYSLSLPVSSLSKLSSIT